jgi:hypothetical protein
MRCTIGKDNHGRADLHLPRVAASAFNQHSVLESFATTLWLSALRQSQTAHAWDITIKPLRVTP